MGKNENNHRITLKTGERFLISKGMREIIDKVVLSEKPPTHIFIKDVSNKHHTVKVDNINLITETPWWIE